MLSRIVPVLLAVAVAAPARAAEEPPGIPGHGAVVELGFGGGVTIGGVGAVGTPIPTLMGGLRLIDRLTIGVGFTFFRLSTRTAPPFPGGMGMGADINLFNFSPTVEVDLVKSSDRRSAFYLKGGLPLGALIVNYPSPMKDDSGFVVGYHVAFGARFAFSRFFAFGMETGLLGFFTNPQRSDGNNSVGLTTFYGMLQATVFFAGR